MADAIHGNTQIGPSKQDVIAALVQKELKFAAKLSPYFTDLSSLAIKGSKSVTIPKLSSFTATNRASATAGDATVLSASGDKLDLDINAYVAWIIDESDAVQSTIDWELMTVQRAASAHGRKFDAELIAEIYASAAEVAGAAGNISRDKVLEMRQYIRKNHGDLMKSVICVAPDQETALLKIDEFTRAEVYGQTVIQSGVFGMLYGVPVLVHDGLSDGQFFMAEQSGLCYALQLGPNYSEQGANEFGALSKRRAMDQLFGVKGLQIDGTASTPSGKSSLMITNAY
jgi:hypothetical protein